MGKSQKAAINKSGTTYHWTGENNYDIYDQEFENHLKS
jgi:hypothetical protein